MQVSCRRVRLAVSQNTEQLDYLANIVSAFFSHVIEIISPLWSLVFLII